MKISPLVRAFLCLFLILGLQGCGQKKGANSSEKTSGVATTNEIVRKSDAAADSSPKPWELFQAKTVPDWAKDFAQLKADAEKGDPEAQYDLGRRYASGQDVSKNDVEAVKWYRKAAEQGDVDAQCALGGMYDNGDGVTQDYVEAAKWLRMAAEQGNVDAESTIGSMYLTATGVNYDYSEAFKFLSKAAEQGDAAAEFNLGVCYQHGEGVAKDEAGATKWYHKAAEQGNAEAQNNLGFLYANGIGVPQDYVEAYKWYNLAAAQGASDGIKNRDNLISYMTPDQISEAQEMARDFQPRQESGSNNSTSPENPTASGSGFFITDDGYLISNYHVVKGATKVRLVTSAGTIDAKVVQVDVANDLALLKADGRFAPLPILPSRSAQLGSMVATIGFPDPTLQGFAPKLAKGEIASLSGIQDDPRYFQVSVPVQPGNSGGALVDERGNVIGIVSAKLDESAALAASGALPENVNYAVKSSLLLSFLESVPNVSDKLKTPNTTDEKFSDVVKSAQDAAVLVLVY